MFRRSWPRRAGRTLAQNLALLACLLTVLITATGAGATGPPISPSHQFGVNFVSAPGSTFSNQSQRYASAAATGSAWNRWVIYWSNVEASCGDNFDWSGVDPVVDSDASMGLTDDAVLLGTPLCYATTPSAASLPPPPRAPRGGIHTLSGSTTDPPTGLYNPVFADNTDTWAPGKAPNPNNPWARFVNTVVARYHGQVHNWEIWNEPDYSAFWSGSLTDYARLLKVAYLAAHAADSSARILVGGMMYWQWTNTYGTDQAWLKQFLPILTSDPYAADNGYYFDVIPWHFYSRSMDAYTKIQSAAGVLASFGITGKQLWLNETNAPACDDQSSAGPYVTCSDYGPGSDGGATGYASDAEQAAFIIQATAFAFAGGANQIFQFQLQDDGNTQALGMYRNDGSVRPIYQAYQLASQYLAGFTVVERSVVNGAEQLTFGVPGAYPRRVTVLFDDNPAQVTASITAAGAPPSSVSLIQQDGTQQGLTPAPSYNILLPGATDNRNYDVPWNANDYIIGGQTMLLVESLPPDGTPPVSAVTGAALIASPLSINLTWSGSDPNGWGVANYTIQYRDLTTNGGWTNWLTGTTGTAATFSPIANHQYQFRSLAQDWAGNVESKCPNQADASVLATSTQSAASATALPYRYYFPLLPNWGSFC